MGKCFFYFMLDNYEGSLYRNFMKSVTGLVLFSLFSSSKSLTCVKSEAEESLRPWKSDEECLMLRTAGRQFDRTPFVGVRFGFAIKR